VTRSRLKGLQQSRINRASRAASMAPDRRDDGDDGDVGDVGDFETIAEAHRDYLLRVALRLSGNLEVARDLVQDTLTCACRHFQQFQQGSDARAWLATILTRRYFDFAKHQKVVKKAEIELVALTPREYSCDEIPSIPDAVLLDAIAKLELELRQVIELCCLEELSYRDAGTRLGVPSGTVGSRLKRARDALRTILEHMFP
jgi:RNA polymerase sigma-70 factor, ECF subfamily